jgi:hypothetical protein
LKVNFFQSIEIFRLDSHCWWYFGFLQRLFPFLLFFLSLRRRAAFDLESETIFFISA